MNEQTKEFILYTTEYGHSHLKGLIDAGQIPTAQIEPSLFIAGVEFHRMTSIEVLDPTDRPVLYGKTLSYPVKVTVAYQCKQEIPKADIFSTDTPLMCEVLEILNRVARPVLTEIDQLLHDLTTTILEVRGPAHALYTKSELTYYWTLDQVLKPSLRIGLLSNIVDDRPTGILRYKKHTFTFTLTEIKLNACSLVPAYNPATEPKVDLLSIAVDLRDHLKALKEQYVL